MNQLFTLSASLLISFTSLSASASSFSIGDPIFTTADSINNNPANAIKDSIPAPAPGLLKKLLQALQFRKNARAKEQARVLNIIARSGLKDSLQASVRTIDSINTVYKTTAMRLQEKNMKDVLNAIESLTSGLKKRTAGGDTDDSGDLTGLPSTDVDVPVDDQEIQTLVKQVLSPVDTRQQDKLNLVRKLLRQKGPLLEIVPINDSVSKKYSITLHKTTEITAFYPFPEEEPGTMPDLRLIDEISWYAVGFKGATGELTGLKDWETSAVMDSAHTRGCRISLSVMSRDRNNIISLLKSTTARQRLISEIVGSLNRRHADGVIILFDSLPGPSRDSFISFITSLADKLKSSPDHFRLSINLPSYDRDNAYNLPMLKIYTDRFFLDFTRYTGTVPGPLAPLVGNYNNDLKNCLSHYLDMDIAPSSLVIRLPWYGIAWKVGAGRKVRDNTPVYVTYSDIRKDSQVRQATPIYDSVGMTIRIDGKNRSGALRTRLWYDDERTLGAKYDFIIHNQLGGIAIQAQSLDEGYGDLWDVLALKFTRVDTVESELKKKHRHPPVLDDWQWSWPYISAKIEQYDFLFSYPCETKFPKVLIRKWEAAGVKNNSRKSIWSEATTVLGVASILLSILSLGGVWLFIARIRQAGDRWKWKRPLAGLLILLFILLTISVFMFLFLDKSVALFGVSENAQDCSDFPLGILFTVIFTGLTIGILITRFFIFPLIKKDDIP